MFMINAGKNVHGLSGAAWRLTTVLQVFASSGPDPPPEEKAPTPTVGIEWMYETLGFFFRES